MRNSKTPAAMAAILMLTACGGGDPAKVTAQDAESYDGISPEEILYFSGTEPFWGGQVSGQVLTYTVPGMPAGQTITVKRFAGLGGLGFSGSLNGASFDMVVTPGECNDGMSDRTYPFTISLRLGNEDRNGCGWTDAKPFSGDVSP